MKFNESGSPAGRPRENKNRIRDGRRSDSQGIVIRPRTETNNPIISTDPPPVNVWNSSELREIAHMWNRGEIARIRKQGQNAILISANGESVEHVMIDRDRRWRYNKRHVGGKVYLTPEHANLYHPRKNPLASEMAGEDLHGPVLILKEDALMGQAIGFTRPQFAELANELELMEPLRISVKRIPDTSSGKEPELVFKPELPGVIGLKRPPTRK